MSPNVCAAVGKKKKRKRKRTVGEPVTASHEIGTRQMRESGRTDLASVRAVRTVRNEVDTGAFVIGERGNKEGGKPVRLHEGERAE